MTNKQKAIENYFKAMDGWHLEDGIWVNAKGESLGVVMGGEFPDIIDHFPSFKKWVLERMEGEGYKLSLTTYHYSDGPKDDDVEWWPAKGNGTTVYCETLEDNEITLAAVEAATQYWEKKK
jgi:hypothetical protein